MFKVGDIVIVKTIVEGPSDGHEFPAGIEGIVVSIDEEDIENDKQPYKICRRDTYYEAPQVQMVCGRDLELATN